MDLHAFCLHMPQSTFSSDPDKKITTTFHPHTTNQLLEEKNLTQIRHAFTSLHFCTFKTFLSVASFLIFTGFCVHCEKTDELLMSLMRGISDTLGFRETFPLKTCEYLETK